MTPAEMQPAIPYIVTRGSAALGLVRGDRVDVTARGELVAGWKFFRTGWNTYLFSVEPDRDYGANHRTGKPDQNTQGDARMRIEETTITPDIAAYFLNKNTANRTTSTAHVKALALAMERGEWIANGDTISFCDGRLVDGQHRLQAIILSGIPMRAIIVHDVPSGAFSTKDCGKRRTTADALHVNGYGQSVLLSAAVVVCLMIAEESKGRKIGNSGGLARPSIGTHRVLEYIESNPSIVDRMRALPNRYVGRPAVSVAIAHLSGNIDFVNAVHNGIGLEADSPAYVLREALLKAKASTKSVVDRRWEVALWIKALNAHNQGQKMKLIRFTADEQFPTIKAGETA